METMRTRLKSVTNPKSRGLVIILLALACVATGLDQPGLDKGGDPYSRLKAIIDSHVATLNQSNSDPKLASAVHKEASDFIEQLQLPGQGKAEFLLSHINSELLDLQRREILVRTMLAELIKEKVSTDQLQGIATFLNRRGGRDIDASLLAGLIAFEDGGLKVFSTPGWGAILKSHLESGASGREILTQHLLETAEREHWKPYGTSVFPAWSGEEQTEIGRASLATEKTILARQYVQEKLLK